MKLTEDRVKERFSNCCFGQNRAFSVGLDVSRQSISCYIQYLLWMDREGQCIRFKRVQTQTTNPDLHMIFTRSILFSLQTGTHRWTQPAVTTHPPPTQTHTHTHIHRADTHRPVGPKSLKKQTEYKYLKPALLRAAAETVSVLILTLTSASFSLPSSAARLCCNCKQHKCTVLPSHTRLQRA